MNVRCLFLVPLIVLAATAAAAAPAGWIAAKSHKGQCRTMVPGTWTPGFAGLGMDSPGKKSTVLVSNKDGSVAQTKAMMPSVFKITKTYEDSASRYWIEYAQGAGAKRHWYVVTPAASGICTAILDFDSSVSEADAKTIAASLGKF